MARTLSINEDGDLDFVVADGLTALRQRIRQALLLRLGTWFADTRLGLPYDDLLARQDGQLGLSQQIITNAIREDGGEEVTDITDIAVTLDHQTRLLTYKATLHTVYGMDAMEETI